MYIMVVKRALKRVYKCANTPPNTHGKFQPNLLNP